MLASTAVCIYIYNTNEVIKGYSFTIQVLRGFLKVYLNNPSTVSLSASTHHSRYYHPGGTNHHLSHDHVNPSNNQLINIYNLNTDETTLCPPPEELLQVTEHIIKSYNPLTITLTTRIYIYIYIYIDRGPSRYCSSCEGSTAKREDCIREGSKRPNLLGGDVALRAKGGRGVQGNDLKVKIIKYY